MSLHIPDDQFIRGNVPMTKQEIRSIIVAKLQLDTDDILLDVGAGTGSVSIEASKHVANGKVYAVEINPDAVELIHKNVEKHKCNNITVIEGGAPESLDSVPTVNKVFIGGSKGNLKEILDCLQTQTTEKCRYVISAIVLDTMIKAVDYFESNNFSNVEVVQVAVNKLEKIGNSKMLKAQNPIFIISGIR